MSGDSSSCELVRIHSNPRPVEWEACPDNKDFILKIEKGSGKAVKMVYTLKEGTPLPYYKPIIYESQGWFWLIEKYVEVSSLASLGLELVFCKTLKPVLDGRIGWEDEKGHWIFEGWFWAAVNSVLIFLLGPVTPSDSRKRGSETPVNGEKTPVSSWKTSVSRGQTPISSEEALFSEWQTPVSSGKTQGSGGKTHGSGEKNHVSGGKTHVSGGKTHVSGGMTHVSGGMTHVSGGKTHVSVELTPEQDQLSFTDTSPSESCLPSSARTLKKPYSSRKTLSFNSLDLAGVGDMIENIDTAG